MEKKEVIRLENVYKSYWDGEQLLEVLKNVNVTIYEGEFVSIVAPSGSGKSTLLHIMGLLDKPTKGKVYLQGKDVLTLKDDELAHFRGKHIGFVFQSFNLIPELTALENVMLPMWIIGVPEEEAEIRAKQLLERVGLGHRLNFIPAKLSGGQKQRVAIARALTNNPSIIFGDEPTGNLDEDTAKEILELFLELHRQGNTLVIVTHDMKVAKLAQRILTIKNKTVVEL